MKKLLNSSKITTFCHKTYASDYCPAYFNGRAAFWGKISGSPERPERKQALIRSYRKGMMQAKRRVVCSAALSVTINHNLSCAADSFKDYGVPYICTEQGSAKSQEKSRLMESASFPECTEQLRVLAHVPVASSDPLRLLPSDT